MAIMAAQASACLDPSYCFTCVAWQRAQVAGVGSPAFAASAAVPWAVPWQESHPTATAAWRESLQSETMPGVDLEWHSTQRALAAGGATGRARSSAATAGRAASIISGLSYRLMGL
jgi:hypothetical protein